MMNNPMIYEYKTHSLYYEHEVGRGSVVSLMLDTLELVYDFNSGKLLSVTGFLPLIHAAKVNISLGISTAGNIYLKNINDHAYQENFVYDMLDTIMSSKKYFSTLNLRYDMLHGIIQIGTNLNNSDQLIKINDNIVCGIDVKEDLKSVYLIPSEFRS